VQRGLPVNFVPHVGDMLERTNPDLDETKHIYDQAEVIEFCSATASRATDKADPHNLIYCPHTISRLNAPEKARSSLSGPSKVSRCRSAKAGCRPDVADASK
jgi:hypothetical protein